MGRIKRDIDITLSVEHRHLNCPCDGCILRNEANRRKAIYKRMGDKIRDIEYRKLNPIESPVNRILRQAKELNDRELSEPVDIDKRLSVDNSHTLTNNSDTLE